MITYGEELMSDKKFDSLKRIQELCDLKGWSLYHLASMSDISYSNLNNIVNRGTQPTVMTIERICKGFNISLSEFFSSDIPTFPDVEEFSVAEKEIINAYRDLNRNKKKQFQAYLDGLSKK